MSARSAGPVLVTMLDTPAGPLSLLAHADTLVGAGFTGDPASLHARLEPALRAAELTTARPQDLAWLVKPMRDYFDGDLKAPDGLPVRQPGSPGRQRLWDAPGPRSATPNWRRGPASRRHRGRPAPRVPPT